MSLIRLGHVGRLMRLETPKPVLAASAYLTRWRHHDPKTGAARVSMEERPRLVRGTIPPRMCTNTDMTSSHGPSRPFHTHLAKALMVDTLKIREASMYDKDSVLELDSMYERGYDPLVSQYEEHLLAPYRHCYVAENQHRELLGYFSVSVVDEGRTLTFTPSRHFDPDLIPLFLDHVTNAIRHKAPNLCQILGVFHSPDGKPEAEVTKRMKTSGKEILKRHVCRLELPREDVAAQVESLEDKSPPRITKIVPSKLWNFLENTNLSQLFPDHKMIVCGEGYSVTKGNLDMLWGTKIRNVHVTSEGEEFPRTSALSIRNNYLVQNAVIHFVDIFASSDDEVFGHFVTQLRDSLRHPGPSNVNHVYSVHVPAETDVDLFYSKCQQHLKTRVRSQCKRTVSLVEFDAGLM